MADLSGDGVSPSSLEMQENLSFRPCAITLNAIREQ
jgi:hypothetical protein